MQITQEQHEMIARYLPTRRGNASMTHLQLINAILYAAKNGCKWRAVPEAFDESVVNQAVSDRGNAVRDLAMGQFGDYVGIPFVDPGETIHRADSDRQTI